MSGSTGHRIFTTTLASVYPLYLAKVERKGRTRDELDTVIRWLTGYDQSELDQHLAAGATFAGFFDGARLHPDQGASRASSAGCAWKRSRTRSCSGSGISTSWWTSSRRAGRWKGPAQLMAFADAQGARYCRTHDRGGLLMRSVTYSMGVSLDGYIVGPDGGFDWTAPDEEVFRFWIDEIRQVGVHLLGRRLYETMLYWETADQNPSLDDAELEWAALWNPLPKVVFSTTLSAVEGNARLASGGLVEEIERLRAEPGESDIAIGGATLAAEAAALGLIDEYRAMVYPVLVGGGIPFFPRRERRVDLELVETRTFSSGVVYLRYRVVRRERH